MQKIKNTILYEPRPLFHHAARHSIESHGCSLTCIHPGGLSEEVITLRTDNALFATGLSGAGDELFSLLRIIHSLAAENVELTVWIPAGDALLVQLMYGLGVQTLLCESYLQEELPQRIRNPAFSSPHLPQWCPPDGISQNKVRLTDRELDTLIDCARGLNPYEIASLRHASYKTIYVHRSNVRRRLNLGNSVQWLDLLARLTQFRTLHSMR